MTDIACMALNGMKMGDKTLTVRRATASGQAKPDQISVLAQAQQQIALQKMALTGQAPGGIVPGVSEVPTKVVCLSSVSSNSKQKQPYPRRAGHLPQNVRVAL